MRRFSLFILASFVGFSGCRCEAPRPHQLVSITPPSSPAFDAATFPTLSLPIPALLPTVLKELPGGPETQRRRAASAERQYKQFQKLSEGNRLDGGR